MKKTMLTFKHKETGIEIVLLVDATGKPAKDQKAADEVAEVMEDAGYELQPKN